jgi:ABC-type lipopolysaccharide export system ATPase subunit
MSPDYSFQADVIAEAERQLAAGEKVLLVAPTGSGKTVKGTEIVKAAVARRESVLFLAHRREITPRPRRSFSSTGCGTASSRPASILARWSWCRWRRSQPSLSVG